MVFNKNRCSFALALIVSLAIMAMLAIPAVLGAEINRRSRYHLVPKALLSYTILAFHFPASSGVDVTAKSVASSSFDAGHGTFTVGMENKVELDEAGPGPETVPSKGFYDTVKEALGEDYDQASSFLSLSSNGQGDYDGEITTGIVANDLIAALSSIAASSGDIDNAPNDLKDLASAMALLKNHVSDPQLISSIPLEFQLTFSSLAQQLSVAEMHMEKIGDIISGHYQALPNDSGTATLPRHSHTKLATVSAAITNSTHRNLFGEQQDTSATNYYYDSGASGADYTSRARSQHMQKGGGLGIGGGFVGQQGHFGARMQREEGAIRRRLDSDGGNVCVNVDPVDRKAEQCYRLANCAKNYNLYDMFVFFFGDDINFDSGEIDSRIDTNDESRLKEKLTLIKDKSRFILENPGNLTDGECDQLLQEFHRFDEDIGVKGKWQGGTVTGICRGWGTTKYISLESIYQISETVLKGVKENVEDCMLDLVKTFNSERQNFSVPDVPCGEELPVETPDRTNIIVDIKNKFTCLRESFLCQINDPKCVQSVPFTVCVTAGMWPFWPVFSGVVTFFPIIGFSWTFPVTLPDPLTRKRTGQFLFDFILEDTTAEEFIVDVFEEFVGCASDMVREVNETQGKQSLFMDATKFNPYLPNGNSSFSMPVGIFDFDDDGNDGKVDKYGQLQGKHLDTVLKYVILGDGAMRTDDDQFKFSTTLKKFLVDAYAYMQTLTESEAFIRELSDGGGIFTVIADILKAVRADFADKGLYRSSLDTSISLVFGTKTTVGQVCAYARGLKDGTVDDLPGFCCLDAPYEQTDDWGEKFTCEKYKILLDGSTKTEAKGKGDCKKLGPLTAGFNEAACDIFSGTWCPVPRDCAALSQCVEDLKDDIRSRKDRQAFFEYLDDAPEIKDIEAGDIAECGDLREYFDYDRDYPDDQRICDEVMDLQCLTDFSNLDGYATGSAGAPGGADDLAISTKLRLIQKAPFDPTIAKVWRSSTFAVRKAIDIVEFAMSIVDDAEEGCIVLVSAIAGTASPCILPLVVAKSTSTIVAFTLRTALDISEKMYDELVVNKFDGDYAEDVTMSMYENIITANKNIFTTFAATQQLKVMLGEISEGLAKDDEEANRRRLEGECCDCDDTSFVCGKPNCNEPTRFCDGGYNYPFIALQRGAGCDELDSDGDRVVDDCEDRFPPELVLRNAEIFRCDEDDTIRLCHKGKVFQSDKQARNFLEYQFGLADDCSPSSRLELVLEQTSGICHETVYDVTPAQNIESCNGREPAGSFNISFENPLYGTTRKVTVQVDDEDPVVECGFLPSNSGINFIAGNTLYHYLDTNDDASGLLENANFFYEVTDNCKADVQVDIKVKSNEIQDDTIAKLFKYQEKDAAEQANFYYAATSCEEEGSGRVCEQDRSMHDLKVRFYEITVTVTDSAGNTGSDVCKVVMVPKCDPGESMCKRFINNDARSLKKQKITQQGKTQQSSKSKGKKSSKKQMGVWYYTREYLNTVVGDSLGLYDLASAQLVWKNETDA